MGNVSNHPNLLPAYFMTVKRQIHLSRHMSSNHSFHEKANIRIVENGKDIAVADGPYGEEGLLFRTSIHCQNLV